MFAAELLSFLPVVGVCLLLKVLVQVSLTQFLRKKQDVCVFCFVFFEMRLNTAKHLKMINLQRRHFQSLISPCPALRGAELKRSSRVCLRSPRSSHLQPLSQTPGVWLVGLPWLTIERASKIKILLGGFPFFQIPAPRPWKLMIAF